MPSGADPETRAWASAAVRRFAGATNLLVAARRFRIVGGDPRDVAALRALLTGLGAREALPHEPVDQLWCAGSPEDSTPVIEREADRPRGATLVVVDAGRHLPAVDEDAFGPVAIARPGVLAVPVLSDDVFLVSTGRDPEDDPAAEARLRWARRSMPVSRAVAAELRDGGLLRGTRIGVAMVLEPKTAVLSLLLRDAGAEVVVYAHADETDDAVADALRRAGLTVHANSTASLPEQRALALAMLDTRPHVLLDDGSHVIRLAHQERPDLLPTMLGAAEETTSGLRPLRTMAARGELGIPVVAVNDARTKTFFDNRYGTGQSTVFAVLDLLDRLPSGTHRVVPGGAAVVAGFGHVGEGVALVLTALGLRVTVAETDPVRALQALFAGHAVAPLAEAVQDADLVMSATGGRRHDRPPHTAVLGTRCGRRGRGRGGARSGTRRRPGGRRRADPGGPEGRRLVFPGGEDGPIVLDGGGCINNHGSRGQPGRDHGPVFRRTARCRPDAPRTRRRARPCRRADRPRGRRRDRPRGARRVRSAGRASRTARRAPRRPRAGRPDPPVRRPRVSGAHPVTVHSARVVVPMTAPPIADGAVAVRDGRILHVGDRSWVVDQLAGSGTPFTERPWRGALLPGLVNAHSHLQYTGMASVGQRQYTGFEDWAAAFNEDYAEPHDWHAEATLGATASILAGVTSIADIVTDIEASTVLAEAGLGGIAYWEVMDWENAAWQTHGRDQVLAELERIPTDPGAGLSPHAPYSLDVAPLLELPDIVRQRGLRRHLHLGE
ncbi:adenosylhomocysteinase, partial [Curtobacterium sp. B18]|uniref:adenosylhomocysteinase n=1 Tax=Curtobacterium sp. B18 TaxID=95614 RepID=UPI0016516C54